MHNSLQFAQADSHAQIKPGPTTRLGRELFFWPPAHNMSRLISELDILERDSGCNWLVDKQFNGENYRSSLFDCRGWHGHFGVVSRNVLRHIIRQPSISDQRTSRPMASLDGGGRFWLIGWLMNVLSGTRHCWGGQFPKITMRTVTFTRDSWTTDGVHRADTGCRCKWRKLATGWAVDLFGEHRHATHHYWFRPESGARFFCTHGTESERSISFAYAIECTCRSSSSGFSFLIGHKQLSPSTRERRRMFTSRVECGVWPISAAWIHNAGIRLLCNESSSSFAKPFATGIQFKFFSLPWTIAP